MEPLNHYNNDELIAEPQGEEPEEEEIIQEQEQPIPTTNREVFVFKNSQFEMQLQSSTYSVLQLGDLCLNFIKVYSEQTNGNKSKDKNYYG